MVESLKMIQYLKKRLCVSNKAQFSGIDFRKLRLAFQY